MQKPLRVRSCKLYSCLSVAVMSMSSSIISFVFVQVPYLSSRQLFTENRM